MVIKVHNRSDASKNNFTRPMFPNGIPINDTVAETD